MDALAAAAPALSAVAFALLGYLSGSLSFSIWITHLLKGVDLREAGSGHATTTNTIRQAGFAAGALVLMLDIAKGWMPVWLALRYAPTLWLIPMTAACAVVGHCWPIFAQFRGGMGLATAAGGLLAINPLAFLVAAAILIFLTLIFHHGARASLITSISIAPVYWLAGLRGLEFWIALVVGLVLVVRWRTSWNRKYRELWLDREQT
jgi:glycerol-3-phosphate acyltransferase PlsY